MSRFQASSGAVAGREDAAEAVHGMRAEVGRDPDGPQQESDPGGPVLGVRVEQGRAVLAARIEDVAGPGLDGHTEPQLAEAPGDPGGTGGQVGGERVEVHVVEGQPDAVVAEIGEQPEGVVEPQIGEAVGAVPQPGAVRGVRGGA